MAIISNKLSIGSVVMAKWIILFAGVVILGINAYGVYDMYQPKVGPIGNGEISSHVWISIFISFLSGIIFIAQFFVLFAYDQRNKRFPRMETTRFILRQIELSDAKEVFHYFSQDEVMKYYDLDVLKDVSEARRIIKNWQKKYHKNEGLRWGIATKEDNKIIGSCGYHNWEKEHYKAEIGFELTPEFWRRGVMTEILQPILTYGFENMELNRIEALYDPENSASKRTLEKAGFIYEGTLRKSAFEKGRFCDAAICSLLKEELAK